MCGVPTVRDFLLRAEPQRQKREFSLRTESQQQGASSLRPPERLPLGSPLTLWASCPLRAVKEAPGDEADSVRKTLRGAKAKKRPEMRRILSGSLLGGGAKDRLNPRRF